jgi:polyisoprenyl-phosphate glycosyltransferase
VQTQLAIVVPAHNEEENVASLVGELNDTFGAAGVAFEVLFVDDGSTDRTASIIRALAAERPHVRGLRLSRNFGHQAAVSMGLRHARADAVAVMDADLQDRPSDLLAMYRRLLAGGDVVYAVRRSRTEWFGKRIAYRAFYRLLSSLASVPIPLDSGDFCVMTASFAAQLNALPERLRFVRGLRAWLGGTQIPWPVDRDARRAGVPQYTLRRLVRLALDGLVSFSDAPLRLASVMGLLVSGAAFAGVVVVLVWRFLGLLPSGAGLATIALSVLFLGGVQLLTIGILGEYIGRIFEEVKSRPVAVAAERFGQPASDESPPPPGGER